jgi:hypothetical protein
MRERTPQTIYPWELGASSIWKQEADLHLLRQGSIENILERILSLPITEQIATILELEIHGDRKKAAELARALVAVNPQFSRMLSDSVGHDTWRLLLKTTLDHLPSKPTEFDKHIKLVYLQ